ncbi:MAG: flagellar basal-body rod protein FlgF [Epulopiscium sp.]|uniref:Flagellar basal-body rod protein FlgF n=1 Tax=Defluviitalea raffinosedens TaxID=1450156 RepID=A0A7C8HII2_9FIRM|nr:flagellar basal-body rod protein FlgF [Defluviitalea raffinosedens]MBZ4667026.1 FlgE [Defluviitaleaceae bacterium]MDK2786832.1 flagellar basal-body rod protein FlgF [Candidatus Epulonipiscium sp.]KAE9635615.1 flagellar basal-body rod protein FlgF [Defluviitalea raffinosedens]MBM7684534.1 flagellar basal-body rod protein FlgG [Defluviitalea raffinosedens]HHW68363.1 flagellar basal-body rod protein FlgF [Candidatus Epulonipiscium sp.]
MIRGLYTSAIGMKTQFEKMDILTNNLANVDTTGYKKDIVVSRSFPEELTKRIQDRKNGFSNNRNIGRMSLGLYNDQVYTNYTQGTLKQTDDPLNVAIQGKAFFAVGMEDGREVYTRDGSFALDANGMLMTKEGNMVLGQNGPIRIGQGDVRIDESGNIYVNDELIDQLRIVEFENPETLSKLGDNLLERTEETTEKNIESRIVQGFLEGSNVNVIREMVDMITATRIYEANQKAIQTHDETLGKAVNDVGRV